MFSDLLEAWDYVKEGRTKEQQLRGLMKTTRHVVPDYRPGQIAKHPLPVSRTPTWASTDKAVKARYFARKKKSHQDTEKRSSADLAQGVKAPHVRRKQNLAGVSVARLRLVRDEPSKTKDRKATAARRLPMKFPDRKK